MASKKPGGENKIQDLFSQHVEKIALGIAVLLVFVLLYFGMGKKPLPTNKEPASLMRKVDTARANVEDRTWGPTSRELITKPEYHKKAAEDTANVDPELYKFFWFDPPFDVERRARVDPKLMTIEKITAAPGVIAALAETSSEPSRGGLSGFRGSGSGFGSGLDGRDDSDSGPPTLTEEQWSELDKGFRTKDRSARPVGKTFVVVRGLVPVVEQQREYSRCFEGRVKDQAYEKYAAIRDRPSYFHAYIERQEIGADGKPVVGKTKNGEPLLWTRLHMNSKLIRQYATRWPEVDEPADTRFIHSMLTMPAAPVLLMDYVPLLTHPDVPLKPSAEDLAAEPTRGEFDEEVIEGPDLGPVLIPGGGDIPEGLSPADRTADRSAAKEPVAEKPAEYYLFRFYDFTAKLEKRYRYRVKLLMIDPNRPYEKEHRPETGALHPDVIARLAKQDDSVYYRETDWSEESEIVEFPPAQRILANKIDAGLRQIPGHRPVRVKEPSVDVMALVWDSGEAVWVPGRVEGLERGSVVDFTQDVWVVDPLSLEAMRKLAKYEFKTGYTMADIFGGQQMPKKNPKSKLTVPGEVLLVGEDGNLIVQSEFDDAGDYALYNYTSGEEGGPPRRRPGRRDEGRGEFDPGSEEFGEILEGS